MINKKSWSVFLNSKNWFLFWFLGSFIVFKNDRTSIFISLIATKWLKFIISTISIQIAFVHKIIHLILRRLVWNRLFAFRTYLSEMVLISITKWHKHTDRADKMRTNTAWDFFIFIKASHTTAFSHTIIAFSDVIKTK